MARRIQIAVVGAGTAEPEAERLAEEVGGEIARCGAVLVCGGLGGVMAAAARGAAAEGGLAVGILPTYDWRAANPHLGVIIPAGLGHARNTLVVASADAVIALPGEYGTMAEIALALKLGRCVVGLRAWTEIPGVREAAQPRAAVAAAMGAAQRWR